MTDERSLTPGEIELARTIFADAVDYAAVRLVHRPWWPLQPRSIVMAPTGNIHFHPKGSTWSDDFARDTLAAQGLLIHEMTHVWQAQTRGRYYLPLMRHPFCRYSYQIEPGRPFGRYGLEQQAEIVRHLFLTERGVILPHRPPRDLLPFA
ncbi:vgr related protein [Sphingomonas sp.]|uniref:vgr related protein n=1 Tax=Sphingomonas sp. TaxID=28214 RepID=UPI0037520CB4